MTSRRTLFRTVLAAVAARAVARRGAASAAPVELALPPGVPEQKLDHRDARFKSGRVGLWTKADSVTAFDDMTSRGVSGS